MLQIVDWEKHFENNRTKELKKLSWVPFPNRHDGDGYTELLDHPDGAAHYGCWCAIVQVASKCEPRGTLLRDGARPHDARSLGRMIRIPEKIVAAAIERLVNDVHWLEVVAVSGDTEFSHNGATAPQDDAALQEGNGREGKGRERNYFRSGPEGPTRTDPNRCDLISKLDPEICESIPELQLGLNTVLEPLPPKGLATGAYRALRECHLDDTRAVVEWHARQLSIPDPVLGGTEADLLFALAAARFAAQAPDRDVKKNRVAMFVAIVSRHQLRKVSHLVPEMAIALARYREREAQHAERKAAERKTGSSPEPGGVGA